MIHIKNDLNSTQSISISKYFNEIPTSMRLRLVNTLTKEIIDIEPKKFYVAEPYFLLDIRLNKRVVDGEYNYSLIDNVKGVIAFGLAVVGDYKRDIKTYDDNSNKKIQYNR